MSLLDTRHAVSRAAAGQHGRSTVEPEHLERGRKLSSQALEIVRCIIREIRGGIEHGL